MIVKSGTEDIHDLRYRKGSMKTKEVQEKIIHCYPNCSPVKDWVSLTMFAKLRDLEHLLDVNSEGPPILI